MFVEVNKSYLAIEENSDGFLDTLKSRTFKSRFDLLLLLVIFTRVPSIIGMHIPWPCPHKSPQCPLQTSLQLQTPETMVFRSVPVVLCKYITEPVSRCLNPISFPRETLLSWKNDAVDWPPAVEENKQADETCLKMEKLEEEMVAWSYCTYVPQCQGSKRNRMKKNWWRECAESVVQRLELNTVFFLVIGVSRPLFVAQVATHWTSLDSANNHQLNITNEMKKESKIKTDYYLGCHGLNSS